MNERFCVLPFIHSCTNVGGRNKPCCRFTDNDYYDKIDPKEYFISDKLNKLRKKMIAGEYIEGCTKCYEDEKNDPKRSYRQIYNHKFQSDFDVNAPKIKYIEIGLSNSCNFACVTCNAAYSTTWWKDIDAVNALGMKIDKPPTKVVYTDNFFTKDDLKNVKEVKLLGGEPFMEPRNLDFLTNLDLDNIILIMVTNGSVIPNEDWQEVLRKLKHLVLTISIDGVGETAEFVRYGTNWEKVEKTVNWWVEWSKIYDLELNFHFVVHNFNIHNIPDFERWSRIIHRKKNLEAGVSYPARTESRYVMLTEPKYLDIRVLPREEKLKYIELLDEHYSLNNQKIITYLETHIDYMDTESHSKMLAYKNWLENNR